jgi:hypothetical protein
VTGSVADFYPCIIFLGDVALLSVVMHTLGSRDPPATGVQQHYLVLQQHYSVRCHALLECLTAALSAIGSRGLPTHTLAGHTDVTCTFLLAPDGSAHAH